ncbi:uncharacterized protein N7503_008019 [Penicillium pulvis]|uniref:uncharacterized protein n=1 Tax=Penicillium pulvis TaxID=1562058 RepID=UPI00254846AB|nr:uncharacterized protein N7503_008019 [Penicillium pulvis]KAJ5792041.1 hypothetical protein N7503_008019 [Penicillium pulvis]
MSDPPQTNTEYELPAPTINGTNLPPGFWAIAAQNPSTILAYNPNWKRAMAEIKKGRTLMNSMCHLPLLREPAVVHRTKRWKDHWPWTGKCFSDFISSKMSNYTGLLAQATGGLLDGDDACHHCQQGMGMFDGCVRVPGLENCANCHIGGKNKRCSLGSGILPHMTTRHDVVAGGHISNAQQLLDRARKEQADLQLVLAKNQYVVDQMQCVLDQARDMLDRTQRMLSQKTQEVNALIDAVNDESDI